MIVLILFNLIILDCIHSGPEDYSLQNRIRNVSESTCSRSNCTVIAVLEYVWFHVFTLHTVESWKFENDLNLTV
jgi:hypothetical protein